jgi:magnesium chelatase family protein
MPRVPPGTLVDDSATEGSAPVAARIAALRRLQAERQGGLNGALAGTRLRQACRLGHRERERVVQLADGLDLSARGVERLLRAARTIADLEGDEVVGTGQLDQAGRFRALGTRAPGPLAI